MKRMFLALGAPLVMLSWLAGARVQADMIQWTASGSVQTANVPGYETGNVYSLPAPSFPNAQISMNGANASGTNSGSPIIANLSAQGSADGGIAEFGGPSSHYTLSLLLHDQASGASGTLTFNGYFGGELPMQGSTLDPLTNTFVGPTTQTLKLGSNLYSVAIGPVVLPTNYWNPEDNTFGSISASISVQPLTSSAPEPSSLLLACLSLPPLGLARWLRRRKVVDSNA